VDGQGKPLRWAWDMVGGKRQKSAVQSMTSNQIAYHYAGMNYQLQLAPDGSSCRQLENGSIRLNPNRSGSLGLILNLSSGQATTLGLREPDKSKEF
jgi:hypothetical protein